MVRVLLLCWLMAVAPAHAQEAVGIDANTTAPFPGVLVPPAIMRQMLDATVERNKCEADLAATDELHAIDAREWAAKLDACRAGWDACEAEPAVVVERRGWSGWAVAGVVVLGVVLAGLTGYAVGAR